MGLQAGDVLIDDATHVDFVGGDKHGLVPRDYKVIPVGSFCPTFGTIDMPLIPRSEWSDRIKEMESTRSRISDVLAVADNGKPIEALYQDGWPYCWGYSTGHAITAARAVAGLPYVKLSPFAVAYIIQKGRKEGAWGALSMQWAMDHGYPSQAKWPNLKADMRLDTADLRADMAKHKVTEGWIDLADPVYNRNLTFDQMMTCLLCRIPVVTDFNWWGHSVCAIDPVEVEPGSFAPRILNSHGTVFKEQLMVLQGARGVPNGATALRSTNA